jgi:hypothetical protein
MEEVMSSREEFEAWAEPYHREAGNWYERDGGMFELFVDGSYRVRWLESDFVAWQASRAHESDLLAALKAITNSGPDAIPINEAFEMAHRAIERVNGGKV